MAFDSVIISFTTKTDKVDLVQAAHMNAVQAELVTIETILGTNVKGDRADLKTRLNNALDADGSILSGTAYPSPALPSQPFYKTDVDIFYIRNAANTSWIQQGANTSNILFQYSAQVTATGSELGEYSGTSLVPNAVTGNYRFLQGAFGADTYGTVWASKFTKISGVSTITIYGQIWNQTNGDGRTASLKVDVGGQNGSVAGSANRITPEWVTFTVDVSSLSNGTVYDVTVQIKCSVNDNIYLGNLISFGS